MTGMEMIGPMMGMASKAMSSGGGGKGGGGGGGNKTSPEQAALAQYHYGENLLKARAGYASHGTGESTMATQASGGARNQFAKEMAQASDKNSELQALAGQQLQGIGGQNAEAQGFSAGAGGFGSQSGGFGR